MRNITILNTGRQLLQTLAPRTEQCSKHLYQIVLWLQGVSLLLRVQHYHHQNIKNTILRTYNGFFSSHTSRANNYTLARFRQQGIIYCRVTTVQQLQRFTYIGSTKHTINTRESTRNRKFKQVTSHKIVQAELSLRWWHKHKCYHQFVPITLKANITDQDLEATENTFHSATSVQTQFSVYYQSHERRFLRIYQGRQQQTQWLGGPLGQTPPRQVTSFYPQLHGHRLVP